MKRLFWQESQAYQYKIREGYVEILAYTGQQTQLVIPSEIDGLPVRALGTGSFRASGTLKSVLIPEGVTGIGSRAFESCKALCSVIFPKSLQWIGSSAFGRCESLIEAELPDGLQVIDKSAFYGCVRLERVIIGKYTKTLADWAFYGCPMLRRIEGGGALRSVGKYCFGTDFDAFDTVDGCVLICGGTMMVACDRKRTRICIPEGVVMIVNSAVENNAALEAIQFPKSLRRIGKGAFENCEALRSLVIPGNVREIGDGAFKRCAALQTLTLCDGIDRIGKEAFSECGALASVTIPASIARIEDQAFQKCRQLEVVQLHERIKEIGKGAFEACENLRRVDLPAQVETICDYAFYASGLEHLMIPACVRKLGYAILGNCRNFKKIYTARPLPNIGLLGADMLCQFAYLDEGGKILWKAVYMDDLAYFSPKTMREVFCAVFRSDGAEEADFRGYDLAFDCIIPGAAKLQIALMRLQCPLGASAAAMEQYTAFLKENDRQAVKMCIEQDHAGLLDLLCQKELLGEESVRAGLEAAVEKNLAECTAVLLEYQRRFAGNDLFDQMKALDWS